MPSLPMPPQIRRLRDENTSKTWLLMGGFMAATVALGYFVSTVAGNPGYLAVAFLFAAGLNLVGYFYADKIALSMSRAKPADPVAHARLFRVAAELAPRAGLPVPRLYVIDDPSPNAFATGRNPEYAAVAVTTGLLAAMDDAELAGVVGHELGHVRSRDILLSTVVVIVSGVFVMLADFAGRLALFGGDRRRDGGELALVGLLLSILAPIGATLLQLAISRRREFVADAAGAELAGSPEGLASALRKIDAYKRPMLAASNATAHLFFGNPFGADRGGAARGGEERRVSGLARLFMSHPPVYERVAALLGRRG